MITKCIAFFSILHLERNAANQTAPVPTSANQTAAVPTATNQTAANKTSLSQADPSYRLQAAANANAKGLKNMGFIMNFRFL